MDEVRKTETHEAQILDQFTRQADPFVKRHAHTHDALLELMADCASVGPADSVLDVACGPGIVSCFFALRARLVTGLDIVPAMLERARLLQSEQAVPNVTWKLGPSTVLPFPSGSFDCAVTRFSFHHFLDPEKALREMTRVVKPGGIVLVCDVAPEPEVQELFNFWEILLDPSHTRAFTAAELESMGARAGLEPHRKSHYRMEMNFEKLLGGSFPNPGDADRLRALFAEEVAAGTDRLGVAAHRSENGIRIVYPVILLAWRKPR